MSKGESAFNEDAFASTSTTHYLTLNQAAVGNIASSSDRDWYQVWLVAGVNYGAAAIGAPYGPVPAAPSVKLRLYSGNGTELGANSANGGIGFSVTQTGLYYIGVEGGSAASTGAYQIELGRTAFGDDYGGNPTTAGEIVSGVVTSGALQVAADNDAFLFEVEAGKRYFWSVATNISGLVYTLDTPDFRRLDFGLLPNGSFGEVIATQSATLLLSLASNTYQTTGTYSLLAQQTYSTDKALKVGTAAANTIAGTSAADEIWGWDGNDVLSGGAASDILVGGRGNDKLDGGTGADRMIGKEGNDTYTVNTFSSTAKDLVEEAAGAANGTADIVKSSVTYTLPANVELLVLTGGSAINGTGNGSDNTITGNNVANTLKGLGGNDIIRGDDNTKPGGGNDIIQGGVGNDKLYGGRGNDTLKGDDASTNRGLDRFYFDTPPNATSNRDTILDFNPTDDGIYLKKSVFSGIAALGTLSSGAFHRIDGYNPASPGARTPTTADDRIIYDKVSGKLYYDVDGAGGTAAVLFAIVNNGSVHPTLTNADFIAY